MIETLRAALSDRAAALAAHDGVSVAVRHLHAAAHEATALIAQARDALMREFAAAARPPAVPPSAAGGEAAPQREDLGPGAAAPAAATDAAETKEPAA